MSETEATADVETLEAPDAGDKKREPKKNSIPADEIKTLIEGLPQYTKTSFLVVGYKNGVRLAIPKTTGVSRTYFYANDDYSLIPEDEAITVFDEADRKEHRRGGIMAEIDYDKGLEAARRALTKLIDVVKATPAPAEKPAKVPRAKKEPKAEAAPAAEEPAADSAEAQA